MIDHNGVYATNYVYPVIVCCLMIKRKVVLKLSCTFTSVIAWSTGHDVKGFTPSIPSTRTSCFTFSPRRPIRKDFDGDATPVHRLTDVPTNRTEFRRNRGPLIEMTLKISPITTASRPSNKNSMTIFRRQLKLVMRLLPFTRAEGELWGEPRS